MFILSGFGLSEVLGNVAAGFMSVIYSNLYIPAQVYSAYKIWQGIVSDGQTTSNTYRLYAFSFVSFTMMTTTFSNGMDALYFMNQANSPHADTNLYPALFYWINWLDHIPRQ